MDPFPILRWPDPRLRVKAENVSLEQENLQELSYRLIKTMLGARGIGLAATQIGIPKRILAMLHADMPIVLINPSIVLLSAEKQKLKEGCLSFPNVWQVIERPRKVVVEALTPELELKNYTFQGLECSCFLHELDHLDGKVFLDHLSPLKQALAKKKMKK